MTLHLSIPGLFEALRYEESLLTPSRAIFLARPRPHLRPLGLPLLHQSDLANMPRPRPSTNSTRHEDSPSPPIPHFRLQQASLDTTLAGEGAWCQAPRHENGVSRTHDRTAFPPQMIQVAGETDNEELFDKAMMSTDFCNQSTSIYHLGARENPAHSNTALGAGAEVPNDTSHHLQCREPSPSSEELGARQFSISVNASLYHTEFEHSNHIHLWLANTPGYCNVPSIAQGNDGVVVHRTSIRHRSNASTGWPTRGRDAASTRWKSRSSLSHDNDRDTMGAEGGFELIPVGPYERWIDIDKVSPGNAHRSA